jgi:hypothetical protein
VILEQIGSDRIKKVGFVGTRVADVMAVFDSGTLTERLTHITEFLTNVLGRDLMNSDPEAAAKIERYIEQSGLNLVYLEARRGQMRAEGMDPVSTMATREKIRAIAPLPEGGVVERHQDTAREKRPAGEDRELGLTLAETGFRFSARQVRAQRRIDPRGGTGANRCGGPRA